MIGGQCGQMLLNDRAERKPICWVSTEVGKRVAKKIAKKACKKRLANRVDPKIGTHHATLQPLQREKLRVRLIP
jgi:hypothetical protein